MFSDNLWTITVTIALSSLLILAYFTLSPMMSKEGTVEQTKTGLDKAINKVETLRVKSNEPISMDHDLKP